VITDTCETDACARTSAASRSRARRQTCRSVEQMPLVTRPTLRQHDGVMDDPGALELAYLPIDRRQALARGEELPARAHGAVLFADVSGFTSTTEPLAATLGPQRGAEALTQVLDAVYAGLVAEVHAYRGSVISFAGDAITCFFAEDDGQRALACGLALHRALPAVRAGDLPRAWRRAIELKVAVSVGEVRRFSAGDPAIQLLDILAGAPLEVVARAGAVLRVLLRALTAARTIGLPYSEAEAHLAAATLLPTRHTPRVPGRGRCAVASWRGAGDGGVARQERIA